MVAHPFRWLLVLLLVSFAYAWPVWLHQGLSDRLTSLATSIQKQGSRLDSIPALVDKVAALESVVLTQREMLVQMPDQWNTQMEALENRLSTSIQEQGSRLDPIPALVDKVAALESAVSAQRGMLDHALGHGVPVRMSDQWNTRMEALENRLSEPASWPAHAGEATEFLAAVSTLVSELSPLAEASYFARLARLRWSAVAFDVLLREHDADEVLFDQVEQLRAIADAKPPDVDAALEAALRERAKEVLSAAEESAFDAVVDRAQSFLESSDARPGSPCATPHDDLSRTVAELQDTYDDLGAYLDHATRSDDVEALRARLGRRLSQHEARDRVTALRKQWCQAKELAGTHADAYEAAASMLLGEITGARAMTALSDLEPTAYDGLLAAYDGLLTEIRAAVHEVQDGFRRAYQQWALNRIVKFVERHEEISGLSPGWFEQPWEAIKKKLGGVCADPSDCRALRDAMLHHLLPIDHLLLAPPVLKRYQRAFDAGWTALDGNKEQICVAIAAAIVPKRALRDVGDAAPGSDAALDHQLQSDDQCA
ncbi:MAG: hypothetical protein OXH50_03305 [Gemmatimonadetes bacterium]|nr:hypothetical protein [Gemmatimonadota bacterium]